MSCHVLPKSGASSCSQMRLYWKYLPTTKYVLGPVLCFFTMRLFFPSSMCFCFKSSFWIESQSRQQFVLFYSTRVRKARQPEVSNAIRVLVSKTSPQTMYGIRRAAAKKQALFCLLAGLPRTLKSPLQGPSEATHCCVQHHYISFDVEIEISSLSISTMSTPLETNIQLPLFNFSNNKLYGHTVKCQNEGLSLLGSCERP